MAKSKVREKITYMKHMHLIGPMRQRKKYLDQMHEEGYHITRMGPKMKSAFRIDPDRFEFFGEKEVCATEDWTALMKGRKINEYPTS